MPSAHPSASGRPELAAIREYMIVDGKPLRQGQGEPIAVHDPATGEVIATQLDAGAAQIDLAVQAARRAFASGPWRDMLPAGRERLLLNLADLVERHGEEQMCIRDSPTTAWTSGRPWG